MVKEEVFGMSLRGFKTEYHHYTRNTGKGDLYGEGGSIKDLALRLKEADGVFAAGVLREKIEV